MKRVAMTACGPSVPCTTSRTGSGHDNGRRRIPGLGPPVLVRWLALDKIRRCDRSEVLPMSGKSPRTGAQLVCFCFIIIGVFVAWRLARHGTEERSFCKPRVADRFPEFSVLDLADKVMLPALATQATSKNAVSPSPRRSSTTFLFGASKRNPAWQHEPLVRITNRKLGVPRVKRSRAVRKF